MHITMQLRLRVSSGNVWQPILQMYGLQTSPLADADPHNVLDQRNDSGFLVDKNLQVRTGADPVP